MTPNPRTGYILCGIAAVVWAATSPGISYLLDVQAVPALTVALWRDIFIALACVGGLLLTQPRSLLVGWRDLRGFALTGAISVGLYHAIFVSSIALNGAALAIVLIYLYPTFVTLGAAIFFKERISAMNIVALGLALIGCVLLVRAYDPSVLRVSWIGILVGIASAVTHAGYVLFNQRSVTRHSPIVSLALTMSFGALVLLVLTLVIDGPSGIGAIGARPVPWLVLLFLALGPTLIGYWLFTTSLRHIPGRIASLLVVVEAPISTLIAVALLGESLDLSQIAGMGLILLAAVLPGLPIQLERRSTQLEASS